MKGPRHLTIVIKLGTSSIVDEKTHEPILSILTLIVETAVKLHKDGHKVIIVSSGAIGVGLRRMDIEKRPKHLPRMQALAAVGQCRLMSLWDSLFAHLRQPVAQILLTRSDIADRTQYLNAQNTFAELLNMGVIPIVNENDTIAVSEIKFGDNDTLSAITAAMVQADYLFLMTDVDCLYDKNPRSNYDAQAIEIVSDISSLEADVSTSGSALGTGGMGTKIVAARLATSAGVTTVITKSSKPGNVKAIIDYLQAARTPHHTDSPHISGTSTPDMAGSNGDISPLGIPSSRPPLHTRFLPSPSPIRNRSFWLLHGLAPHGTIYIDAGAYRALRHKHGLLPVGIIDVEGSFAQQEAVRIVVADRPFQTHTQSRSRNTSNALHMPVPLHDPSSTISISETFSLTSAPTSTPTSRPLTPTIASRPIPKSVSSSSIVPTTLKTHGEVGRALVNYSSAEIARIKGLKSTEILALLGYADSEYVALRENVSLLGSGAGVVARVGGEEGGEGGAEGPGGKVEGDGVEEINLGKMGSLSDFA